MSVTVEQLAHKIVSQAGMLGLMRLSEQARRLEEVARAQADRSVPLAKFREAVGDFETYVSPRLQPPEISSH